MTKTVLVCGSRNFKDWEWVRNNLDAIICFEKQWITGKDDYGNYIPDVKIVTGGASGVDTLAIDWAVSNLCHFKEYKADWDRYKIAGKKNPAGMIRNREMLKEAQPDLVIAFEGGNGTAHMIKIARKAGIEVIEVRNS